MIDFLIDIYPYLIFIIGIGVLIYLIIILKSRGQI